MTTISEHQVKRIHTTQRKWNTEFKTAQRIVELETKCYLLEKSLKAHKLLLKRGLINFKEDEEEK